MSSLSELIHVLQKIEKEHGGGLILQHTISGCGTEWNINATQVIKEGEYISLGDGEDNSEYRLRRRFGKSLKRKLKNQKVSDQKTSDYQNPDNKDGKFFGRKEYRFRRTF